MVPVKRIVKVILMLVVDMVGEREIAVYVGVIAMVGVRVSVDVDMCRRI